MSIWKYFCSYSFSASEKWQIKRPEKLSEFKIFPEIVFTIYLQYVTIPLDIPKPPVPVAS